MNDSSTAFVVRRLVDLHENIVAHARSRVQISRELSLLGRRCNAMARDCFRRNEVRMEQSTKRIARLASVRERTRQRVRETSPRCNP